MIYKNFEELNNAYEHERSDMDFEEEFSYVEDCFDTYEAIGFCDTFNSPYSDFERYKGKRFSVTGRVSYVKDDVDIECLPLWHIKFEDGETTCAYPEEICKAEREDESKV